MLNMVTYTATYTALIKLIGQVNFKKPADFTSSYTTPLYYPYYPYLQLLNYLLFLKAPPI